MYRHNEPPPPPALPPQQSNTLGLISLVAGIISIAGMLASICVGCVGVFSFLAGVAAAVMGYLSKKQIDQAGGRDADRKMANYGMILGIVGGVLSIITVVIGLLLVGFTTGLDWLLSGIAHLV